MTYDTGSGQHRAYWGKYRGTIVDNVDPMVNARLLCQVPSLPGGLAGGLAGGATAAGLVPAGGRTRLKFGGLEPGNPSPNT